MADGPEDKPNQELPTKAFESHNAGRELLRGSAWMVAMRWAVKGIGLVSTVLFARLLVPADFGVVAMALLLVGFLEVFTLTGPDLALIRKENPTRDDYDTAWTFEVLKGAVLAGLVFLAAPFAADYFQEPRVVPVIQVLGFRALAGGLENIGIVMYRRDLDFARDFRFQIYKKLLSFGLAVTLVVVLRDYWGLVWGMLAGRLGGVAISYVMHSYRPRFCLRSLRELWSFSQWVLAIEIMRYGNQRLDEFIVGGLVGASRMGSYHIASDMSLTPSTEFVIPMTRGVYPVLARLKEDPAALAKNYLRVLDTVALFCLPFGVGMSVVAHDLVVTVFGWKWLEAVPLMVWLSLFGSLASILLSLQPLLLVIGKAKVLTGIRALQLAALAALLPLMATHGGIEGVAVGRLYVGLALVPLSFLILGMVSPVTFGASMGVLFWRLLPTAAMWGVVKATHLDGLDLPAATLAMDSAVGATVYVLLSLAIWWARGRPEGPERQIFLILRSRLRW